MRSSYVEATTSRAVQSEWPGRMLRWTTVPFAMACVVADARMIQATGCAGDTMAVLMRSVLLEVEVYLAVVAILMSFQILPMRSERPARRRDPVRGRGKSVPAPSRR